MPLIRKSDIDEVRSRVNIADVVADYVTLKNAGSDSRKGLCPFHDERSPSFHVRPGLGYFHCFGCGESGDVYSFLQKIDHVTFQEAVERLAARIGYSLTYEDGGQAPDHSRRVRLLEANSAASEFFQAQLATPDAEPARAFLGGRGFNPAAAHRFGVGYAPKSWDALTKHLRGRGFTEQELRDAGLVSTGDRGSSYDRFRGRVTWPIRDTSGQVVGFGARKLFDDDNGPKYLNTPETPVYKKAAVLYGLDLAKRDIARERTVVVVEGYTDVMAAHIAGVTTAVATCGTAFGTEHIRVLRRILDDESREGRVVFTFDPDEAGQKAALRAFGEEQRFVASTFVAVARDGLDPCDLRLERGDEAVRELVEAAVPMFEFVIRHHLAQHDLETVEGRVAALRKAAPVIAEMRDRVMQPEYARRLAGWLGVDVSTVEDAVIEAGGAIGHRAAPGRGRPYGGRDDRFGGDGRGRRDRFGDDRALTSGARGDRFGDAGGFGRGGGGRALSAAYSAGAAAMTAPPAPSGGEIDWAPPPEHDAPPYDDGGADPFGPASGHGGAGAGLGTSGGTGLAGGLGPAIPVAAPGDQGIVAGGYRLRDLPDDPVTRLERDALMAVLQHPNALRRELVDAVLGCTFQSGALDTVKDAVVVTRDALGTNAWAQRIAEDVPRSFVPLVTELAMAPLPAGPAQEAIEVYARDVCVALVERDLLRQKAELMGALQRTDRKADPERFDEIQRKLVTVESTKRALREG